ncbi:MAG: hypothetical protein QM538_07270 [Methylacidiphilales bacterium]|nr:hypothetical protein [Candidatus Methylacidiphilales bacterium]
MMLESIIAVIITAIFFKQFSLHTNTILELQKQYEHRTVAELLLHDEIARYHAEGNLIHRTIQLVGKDFSIIYIVEKNKVILRIATDSFHVQQELP